MRFEEYRKHDAISLAGLIAKREVSAEEVRETAIARAEQVNPALNAIVHKQYEQARQAVAAGLPEGPLKGVPYLIKDLGFFETGEPATFGSKLFKDFVADHDTAYVTRCKKAGLVFMGRSASPEFGLNPNTEPRLYGSCHNPWNLEYSPGGSSRRRGGSGCRRHPARGARNRRRRLDPHSRSAVRPVRAQAVTRPSVYGARRRRRMGWPVGRTRGQPQRARLGPHARLHRRPGARRPLCRAAARAPLPRSHRPSAARAQDRSAAERSSRFQVAPRMLGGRAPRGQTLRRPRARGPGGRPRARPGGAAAHERQDLGGQHRPIMQHALEGAGTRTQHR